MIVFVSICAAFLQFFEARNQMALEVLAPARNRSERTIAAQEKTPTPQYVQSRCQACGGSGELVREEKNFGQLDGRIGSPRKIRSTCPLCNGRGKRRMFEHVSSRQLEITRDFEEYCSGHESRGDVKAGNAYIPREIFDSIGKKELKAVENSFGELCKRCKACGLEECKKCKGSGVIQCPEKKCQGGWIVEKTNISTPHRSHYSRSYHISSHSTQSQREKVEVSECKTCKGASITLCQECSGLGAKLCKNCDGYFIKRDKKEF